MKLQFDRFAEVEIRDFKGGVKTIIGDDFEIEFNYFKTLDQTKDDDSGSIRIYGLTPERVALLQVEGGEVHFRCGYRNSDIDTLFVAYIARLYSNNENNTTVTTIECSANLLNYYYSGAVSPNSNGETSLYLLLKTLSEVLGGSTFEIDVAAIPENEVKDLAEFYETFPVSSVFVGSNSDMLMSVCDIFGFDYGARWEDGKYINVFSPTIVGWKKCKRVIANGYKKIEGTNPSDKGSYFYNTLQANPDDKSTTILNFETGLIESKIEYKIAHEDIDEVIYDTDEETFDSQVKRANRANTAAEKAAKESEREAKAKAAGKPFKPRKQVGVKKHKIEVTRKYNRVKALLNPLVKPQSMVSVYTGTEFLTDEESDFLISQGRTVTEDNNTKDSYDNLRVRNVTYRGNNKRNDWVMDLYCEDTNSKGLSDEEKEKIALTNPSESIETEEPIDLEGSEESGDSESSESFE